MNDKYRISIGDAVSVNPVGTYGSGRIRFIGCVQTFNNSEQLFYGVALSNSNGKLDGTHKGVHYFNCKSQHGVLVRPDSLTLMTNEEVFGESLRAVTNSLLKDKDVQKKAHQSARFTDDFFVIPEHYNHHNAQQFAQPSILGQKVVIDQYQHYVEIQLVPKHL